MENVSKQNEKMREFLEELKELLDKYDLSLISIFSGEKYEKFGYPKNFLETYWAIFIKEKIE